MDIFELLDVPRREDTYSAVLSAALRVSPSLRRQLLGTAWASPPALEPVDIRFRHGVEGGIVDILLDGKDQEGQRWILFIENKIDAKESVRASKRGQTEDYLRAARALAGHPSRAAGIFLTLTGERAIAEGVTSISHRALAEAMNGAIRDFDASPELALAVSTYVRRATVSEPAVVGMPYAALLEPVAGLRPQLSRAQAFGELVARQVPALTPTAISIQGVGHSNPGIQFRAAGWGGPRMDANRWARANVDLHFELELLSQPAPLKLHLETSPYRTAKELASVANVSQFDDLSASFRKALHQGLPRGWKGTNYRLQAATWSPPHPWTGATSVELVAEQYGRALSGMWEHADDAFRRI